MDRCPKCGYDLFPTDKVCDKCGVKISTTIDVNEKNKSKKNISKNTNEQKSKTPILIVSIVCGTLIILGIIVVVIIALMKKNQNVDISANQNQTQIESEESIEQEINAEITEDTSTISDGDFKAKYDDVMVELALLTESAKILGQYNCVIWENVGPKNISYVIDAFQGRVEYDFDELDRLISAAFPNMDKYGGNSATTEWQNYRKAYDLVKETRSRLDEKFDELKEIATQNNKDISDLKNYYIEAIMYGDYACGLEGSLSSYSSELSNKLDNVTRLMKLAEMSY